MKQPRLIEELVDPAYEGRIAKVHWSFRSNYHHLLLSYSLITNI